MIDQTAIKRREMLLAASSVLAAAISGMPATAQTEKAVGSKSEPASSAASPDEPQTSASRGRRAS